MSRLETLLDAMRPLLEEQGAYGAWLFGSQARGTAGAESDIDLIVVQPSGEPRPLRRRVYSEAVEAAGGFFAQQAAEKAVRSIACGLGERRVRSHSLVEMIDRYAERAPDRVALRGLGSDLDVHYVEARYPNGQNEGIAAETYTRQMAEEALEAAERFVAAASGRVQTEPDADEDSPWRGRSPRDRRFAPYAGQKAGAPSSCRSTS